MFNLQSYEITAKISLDTIKCHLNLDDYKKIEMLLTEISKSIELFCSIADQFANVYQKLLILAKENNYKVPNDALKTFLLEIDEISKNIPSAYNNSYQWLLNMKRDVFTQIYNGIETEANNILRFGKR